MPALAPTLDKSLKGDRFLLPAMRSLTSKPSPYIRLKPMMLEPSKAFQSGVPLDQILSASHWKSHKSFTQLYLKDVAWADSAVPFRASNLGLLSKSTIRPSNEEMCTNVHIHPSSPTLEQVCLKRGVSSVGLPPVNWFLVTDQGLMGSPDLGSTQA